MPLKEKTIFLEQYKLYVEMADRISERRMKANQFYMTLLSGLLVILSFAFHKENQASIGEYQAVIILSIGLIGTTFCQLWWININSYRQLNSQKFKVIHDLEAKLPFSPYAKEWKLLGEGKDAKKYFQLTRIERAIPLIIMLPYLVLLFFGITSL